MAKEGYILLYRQLLEEPIWKLSTPEQKTILITLLLMAWHKDNEWEWSGKKFKVFAGQFITSIDSIVKECGKGISSQNVRTALKRFEKLEFLTNGSTKSGRLITILKWHTYQVEKPKTNKDTNQRVTNGSQRGNKGVTPNKECNNVNNVKEVYTYYQSKEIINHKSLTDSMKKAITKALTQDDIETLKICIDRHKQIVESTSKKEYPIPKRGIAEFFGQKVYQGVQLIYEEYKDDGCKWIKYGKVEDDEWERD